MIGGGGFVYRRPQPSPRPVMLLQCIIVAKTGCNQGRGMMTRMLGLVCLVLIACCAEASARCSGPRFATFNNQTVDSHITVNSGAGCAIRLGHSMGPTYGAQIVQRASHGTVTIDASKRIVYRSRAGYVGSDSFTYARTGETMVGNAVTRTVRISVTVTP